VVSTYLVLEQYLREHDPAKLDPAFVELLGSAAALLGVTQPVVVGGARSMRTVSRRCRPHW
jgi:hypothetical protein